MAAPLRQLARELNREAPKLARSFKTSAPAKNYHYDYEHGPNYLNFQDWPNRKAKIGAWVAGMMVTGVGLPCFAVWWQQSKLKG